MIIHVVQQGETIEQIADIYGVSAERLILENEINNPNNLVVGETIVILIPEVTYEIQEGDTLGTIADKFDTTISQLLRNNPYLSDREYIYPGETIVIKYTDEKAITIEINSYAYPFISRDILRKTLPFLTYLTVMGYKVTAEGEINNIEDTEIIQMAKVYEVAPIMLLDALSSSMEEEIYVIKSILSNKEKQEQLINNLILIMETKGYSGVNINTPYIKPSDRSIYESFFMNLYERLSKLGYRVYNTFTIRAFQLLSGTIYTGLDYSVISRNVDGIIMITYDFGYSEGIPPGSFSLEIFSRFFGNVTEYIPSKKILMGFSVIGYVWEFPYISGGTRGVAVSFTSAIELAALNNSIVEFDDVNNIAYFQYISDGEYIVRFWDARSVDNFVKFVPYYGLSGVSVWNIMSWFPQMWLVINSQYSIKKVL